MEIKEYLVKMDAIYAENNKKLSARLFLSYSSAEYKPFGDPIAAYQRQLSSRNYKDLHLINYKMDGVHHASVNADGDVRGLMWVWQDMAPIGSGGLARAYGAFRQ